MVTTWIIDGQKAKPMVGATSSNSYDLGGQPILVIAG